VGRRVSPPSGDKALPTPESPERGPQVQLIRTYGPGHFNIAGREWREPVLVTPTATFPWPVTRADELALETLAPLKQASVGQAQWPTELLVVGCGVRPIFVAPDVRAALKSAGMALEVVDTGSACRIYNVLLAEGRRVAAALIPLQPRQARPQI
jgi:uncharacterized protein